MKRGGECGVVDKEGACDGEEGAAGDEEIDEAFLARVEPGLDELPELVDDGGAGDDDGGDERGLEVGHEDFGRREDLQRRVDVRAFKGLNEGLEEPDENAVAEDKGGDRNENRSDEGAQNAAAKFIEVGAETHPVLVGVGRGHEGGWYAGMVLAADIRESADGVGGEWESEQRPNKRGGSAESARELGVGGMER